MEAGARWRCKYCGFEAPLTAYHWRCPRCGRPLDIAYQRRFEPKGRGVARYSGMLPLSPLRSLGEGGTPSLWLEIGGAKVLFKLDHLNPSGSFKDRGTSLALSLAKLLGYSEVVDDTSGNTGISISLYARAYGMSANIVMPATAPEGKKRLARSLGAKVIEAPDRGECPAIAEEMSKTMYYVAHTWNYLYVLGASTIAYEVFEEAGVPDMAVVPVGSGGLLLGLAEGFRSLIELGLSNKMPRLFAVQGYSVQPLAKALKGMEIKGEASDLADGIMVPNPPRLQEIARAVSESRGDVVLVGNSEVLAAMRELLDLGLVVEPTSAAAYAALQKLRAVASGRTVLVVLTGSGLKLDLGKILGP
ncbi:MAG: pyridoxal-phosphate dependent enzyme [Desulfurococcaceae archaeon]